MSVNWASAELGTTLVDFSSEVADCEAQNVLESSMNSIWLTEEGIPQWFCLSLAQIQKTRDIVIRTVGWHCWHPYTTNPHVVTVHVSSDGSKFKQWDTFQAASPQRGTQLFCCAPISASIYPFIAFEVTETFGGNQTYLNRLFLYSDEIATSPQVSVASAGYKSTITGGGDETIASKVDHSESSSLNSDSIQSDYVALKKLEKVLGSSSQSQSQSHTTGGEATAGTDAPLLENSMEDSLAPITTGALPSSIASTATATAVTVTSSSRVNTSERNMLTTNTTQTEESDSIFAGGHLLPETKLLPSDTVNSAQQQRTVQQQHQHQHQHLQTQKQQHEQQVQQQQQQQAQQYQAQQQQTQYQAQHQVVQQQEQHHTQHQAKHQLLEHHQRDDTLSSLFQPLKSGGGSGGQYSREEGGASSFGVGLLDEVSNLSIDTLAVGQVHASNRPVSSDDGQVDLPQHHPSGMYANCVSVSLQDKSCLYTLTGVLYD